MGRSMSARPHLIQLLDVAMVSALVAGLVVHAWDGWKASSAAAERTSQHPSLRFSLGAQTGGLDAAEAGSAVVTLSVVVSNDGTTPVTVRGIEVSGPGAGFVASPPGGPDTDLPRTVAAGQSAKIRFGMSSDCSVLVRPLPTVTFLVQVGGAAAHPVAATIPDLDSIWGMSLLPPSCGAT